MEEEKENNSYEESDILPLEKEKIKKRLKEIEKWNLSSDGKSIFRDIEFNKFKESVNFVNALASFSEKINYYPNTITIKSNKVIVKLTMEQIEGLSKKDFILAKEIDLLADWKIQFQEWLTSTKVIAFLILLFLLVFWWRYLA